MLKYWKTHVSQQPLLNQTGGNNRLMKGTMFIVAILIYLFIYCNLLDVAHFATICHNICLINNKN